MVFAIAAFVAVSVSSQPNKAANRNQEPSKQKQLPVISANSQNTQTSTDANQSKASADPPKWYTTIKWTDWLLVIAGFGTLAVVCWQTAILSKSVAVAQKSAEATSKQVALYVNAERARMSIAFEDRGSRSIALRAKNIGHATAQITLVRGYHMLLLKGYSLPAVPPYLSEPSTNKDFIEWVKVDAVIDFDTDDNLSELVMDLSDTSRCEQIRDKNMSYWVFGRICYGDGITSEPRETRFCYEASVDSNLSTNIVMSGPPAYRMET